MNKKEYLQPCAVIVTIETVGMIAESTTSTIGGNTTATSAAWSRDSSHWDDDEE